MSFFGYHSPKIGRSWSSPLTLAEERDAKEPNITTRKIFKPDVDTILSEHTPLINGHVGDAKGAPPKINGTLMATIFVVTIGSSLQFGYGTGKYQVDNRRRLTKIQRPCSLS
jgi:hypothetical protein